MSARESHGIVGGSKPEADAVERTSAHGGLHAHDLQRAGGAPGDGGGGSGAQGGKWADKKIFTTGEAAEICKVSQQTIIRCFDAGRLGGFRVPGSKFRRIPRAELIRFMQSNEIPTEKLESGIKRVLIVDDDPAIVDLLHDVLAKDGRFEVKTATTGFDAGMLTESFRPHVVLLDFMLPDINGNLVCQRIRGNPSLAETKIIVISGVVKAEDAERLRSAGADELIKKPFNVGQLVGKITSLLGV